MLRAGQRVFLNFGEGTVVDPAAERRAPSGMRAWLESPVREAAQVFVNGKAAGAVWKAPFEVEVTGLLQARRECDPRRGGESRAQRAGQRSAAGLQGADREIRR